jgi:hypothetical protein
MLEKEERKINIGRGYKKEHTKNMFLFSVRKRMYVHI